MNLVISACLDHVRVGANGWNRFWFQPRDTATLGLLRLLTGSMLFYTHLVWSLSLPDFMGPQGIVTPEVLELARDSHFAWSILNGIESLSILWMIHAVALVVLFLFAIGWWTRVTSILAFLVTVSYVNRVPIALFGLDQINGMLALYLMIAPSGASFSVDRLIAQGRGGKTSFGDSVMATIATRLIQLHMCVIYLFAGCGKLLGESWWNGTAIWVALGNLEYQTLDMTWLATWPLMINFLTHLTVVWEVSYIAFIWPRWTRPLVLALAVPLHLGIAFAMGMITFGLVMLIANLAFISPQCVRRICGDLRIRRIVPWS